MGVFDNSLTDYLSITTQTIPLRQWTHVAGTYSQSLGQVKLYINGILSLTKNIGSVVVNHTSINPLIGAYFQQGSTTDTRGHFNGKIDEVRLWYSVRSEADIRDNMCKTLNTPQANLIAYYRFDEFSGTTVLDASGHNLNGQC